jgi:hypothetical protein
MMERINMTGIVRVLTIAMVGLAGMASVFAEELSLKSETKPAPDTVAAPILAELGDTVLQLGTEAGPLYEYWFRKEIPLKEKPASNEDALEAIEEMTLLGVLVAHEEKRDYRDDELWEDTYTMRLSIQPQDGNHLGTSVFPYFAVLLPIGEDESLEGFADTDEMIKVSSDNTAVGHPMIVSLRPVENVEGEFPALKEPAEEHKSLRVKLVGKVTGSGETVDIVFDVVYEGVGEI